MIYGFIIVICVAICYILYYKYHNRGIICSKCGNTTRCHHFTTIIAGNKTEHYVYTCKKCGHSVEIKI